MLGKFFKLHGKKREAKRIESLTALAFLTSSVHYYLVTVHNGNIVANLLLKEEGKLLLSLSCIKVDLIP